MDILYNTKPFLLSTKTGIGYHVMRIYEEIRKSDLNIVATINDGIKDTIGLLSLISAYGRKVMGTKYPVFFNKKVDSILNTLNKVKNNSKTFDIYHETEFEPIPEIRTKKIVFNIYDISVIKYPTFFDVDIAQYRASNLIANAQKSNRILVNSEFIKNEVIDFFKIQSDIIDVIPLATSFLPEDISQENIKSNFVSNKPYILTVGTIEPRKNIKTIISAFAKLRQKYEVSLVIVGVYGWLYDEIINEPIKQHIENDVVFTGYISEKDKLNYYKNALFFVSASYYEGFSMTPLEAMSLGIPSLLSDIPPHRELAKDTAMYFDPYDEESLCHCLEVILTSSELRKKLCIKGLQRAKDYSWERSGKLVIESYKKALNSSLD